MNGISAIEAVLSLIAGAALGAAYFVVLRYTLRLYLTGGAIGHVLPIYILRLGAAGAAFWAIAQYGALPLLLALAGFLAARIAVQCRVGSE